MEIKEAKEQLLKWMLRFKNLDKSYKGNLCVKEYEDRITLKLYTDKNVYSISARPPKKEGDRDYLGAVYSCRKPRAGETWTRGGDLADGKFNHETWVDILGDIIGTELVEIHAIQERIADEEE